MAFRDLAEFLSVEPLVLPVGGKDYAFPADLSAKTVLRMQRLYDQQRRLRLGEGLDEGEEPVSEAEQAEIDAEMWGSSQDEMIADGVTAAQIAVVGQTVYLYHIHGREAAERFWNAQGKPPAPNRKARRAKAQTSTRSRGSRGGSNSRRSPKPKTASAGETSSNTGD